MLIETNEFEVLGRHVSGLKGCDIDISPTTATITIKKEVRPGSVVKLRTKKYVVEEIVKENAVPRKEAVKDNLKYPYVTYVITDGSKFVRVPFQSFTEIE